MLTGMHLGVHSCPCSFGQRLRSRKSMFPGSCAMSISRWQTTTSVGITSKVCVIVLQVMWTSVYTHLTDPWNVLDMAASAIMTTLVTLHISCFSGEHTATVLRALAGVQVRPVHQVPCEPLKCSPYQAATLKPAARALHMHHRRPDQCGMHPSACISVCQVALPAPVPIDLCVSVHEGLGEHSCVRWRSEHSTAGPMGA